MFTCHEIFLKQSFCVVRCLVKKNILMILQLKSIKNTQQVTAPTLL